MRRAVLAAMCAVAACSDGTGPGDEPGTFRLVVSGALSARVTGAAVIRNPSPDSYTLTLTPGPRSPDFGLGLGFFELGRPAVGVHQLRPFGEAPGIAAGCVRAGPEAECPQWVSTRGELRVTRSSPESVAGSFSADLVDKPLGLATARVHVEGTFYARCPAGATCR